MAPFWKSNTLRFRKLPLEDIPPYTNPIDDFRSLCRIVAELGLVSSIFAGVCIQRNGIDQSSPAGEVATIVVMLAGFASFGISVGSLYNSSFLSPRYNYLRPPPPRRRWRRHRAQE